MSPELNDAVAASIYIHQRSKFKVAMVGIFFKHPVGWIFFLFISKTFLLSGVFANERF